MERKYIIVSILILIMISLLLGIRLNSKFNNQPKKQSYLSILVDSVEQASIPAKGNYDVSLSCDNGKGRWNYDTWEAEIASASATTKCTLSFTSTTPVNLNTYIKSLSKGSGDGTQNVSNSVGVWQEPLGDWRYEGKNPDNYLWFNNEYWRIIGVFSDNTHGKTGQELVKIIRDESIGGLVWQKNNVNDWEHATSSLKMLLNNFYYNGTNESTITHCYSYSTTITGNCNFIKNGITNTVYRNMIENVTWYLGGRADTTATASTFYSAERGTTVYAGRPTSGNGYIGLMYPSDYGYSVLANSCVRTTNLGSYNTAACGGNAWLFRGEYEWTITPNSGYTSFVFNVNYNGFVSNLIANLGNSVRPVLYLKSDTKKLSGDGSLGDPFIVIR